MSNKNIVFYFHHMHSTFCSLHLGIYAKKFLIPSIVEHTSKHAWFVFWRNKLHSRDGWNLLFIEIHICNPYERLKEQPLFKSKRNSILFYIFLLIYSLLLLLLLIFFLMQCVVFLLCFLLTVDYIECSHTLPLAHIKRAFRSIHDTHIYTHIILESTTNYFNLNVNSFCLECFVHCANASTSYSLLR